MDNFMAIPFISLMILKLLRENQVPTPSSKIDLTWIWLSFMVPYGNIAPQVFIHPWLSIFGV